MRRVLAVAEWLLLVPLWRLIFRPKILQALFAGGTAIVWMVVILAVVAGGGGEKKPGASGERIVAAAPGATAEAENVRITLNGIADPWIPDNQFIQPPAGIRYVAFEVTIENTGGTGTHVSNPFNLKLTDVQDFAYAATFVGPQPALRAVRLGSGQKTRGWVTFEVNAEAPLKLLRYDPKISTTNDIEFQFR